MENRIVAFVPIKMNSQRLPNKNILPLGGKPLCFHNIRTLLSIREIDQTYVFCSDEKIMNYVPKGATFLRRNKKLDGNFVKGLDIYKEFIKMVDADIYILSHTTSPFLKKESLNNALNKVINEGYDSAFSAEKIQTFGWFNNKPINYNLEDIPRTQDIEPIFIETSSFYIFKKEILEKHNRRIGFNPYIQEVDKIEAIDIDTKEDYEFAKLIYDKIK